MNKIKLQLLFVGLVVAGLFGFSGQSLATTSAPSISGLPSCSFSSYTATISWSGSPNPSFGFYVDISKNNFAGWWNKNVPSGTSTSAPSGFAPYSGVSGSLTLDPGTTYYVRVYDGNHSAVTTFSVPFCSAPSAPVISNTPSCTVSGGTYNATISWGGTPNPNFGFYVDISKNNFAGWWNKNVPSGTSTSAPSGFAPYSGVSGSLTLTPGTTYYARVYNGSHSSTTTFSVPTCSQPTCSSAGPDGTQEPYTATTHRAYAYGVSNATKVWFPTFSDAGGDSDKYWYPGINSGGGTWYVDIILNSHPGTGNVNVDVYMEGNGYSNIWCDTADFTKLEPSATVLTGCYAIRTNTGHYAVAEGGGGPGYTMNANRTAIGPWEKFEIVSAGSGTVAFKTYEGYYAVAEGGGGGAMNADRSAVGPWERFQLLDLGNGQYAIKTYNGHYAVAEGGGGGAMNANRTAIGPWERFTLIQQSGACGPPPEPNCSGAGPQGFVTYETSGTHTVYATGINHASTIHFFIGKQANVPNGPNNVEIYPGSSIANGASNATFDLSNHTGIGTFQVHAWMQSASYPGENFWCGSADFERQPRPAPGTPIISGQPNPCATGPYSNVSISWTGTPNPGFGYYVDISPNTNFATFWNKNLAQPNPPNNTTAPNGFVAYQGVSGSLSLQPGQTYQVRVYNGTHSPTATLNVPVCGSVVITSDTATSWSLVGPSGTINEPAGTTSKTYNTLPTGSYSLTPGNIPNFTWTVSPCAPSGNPVSQPTACQQNLTSP